ncbi:N-acetylglucosamine-6-phosphate deacetylase [Swaminathania salitolerans]|uniref:N-acetylglucosamine-6-phosphate deacetylase n=1 Tax=Swaminathania salitolerans TaxID=182838 RepID=A0A511BLI1_9PROT|nr:N-acetylglucosamine-6-phosphate deacetylase [Swaminathania salitolerans]GBQ10188.1 N-acetylglucosamine-6-phosphate deacetylase [Swaminathania salitolerans LMG 21291]GEL01200.1 N-acetylglucosamine-6-phosphate deacetylase [Swaminathania salitolerans]
MTLPSRTSDLRGHIVLPDRIQTGRITFDSRIRSVEAETASEDRYILPGFIDGHVHGGDGADTMDGTEAIVTLARFHMRHGTTTILPTTITRPWPDVIAALGSVAGVMKSPPPLSPRIHGAHLEGPFVSPHKLGAQPPFTIEPTPERVREILALDCVRVVTLAPEIPHAGQAMELFARAGVRVSLGHTTADHDLAWQAIDRICACGGVAGGTHLFNAMGPIEGRNPGPATALMCHDASYAEMIFDTHHVHPANFRLASRLLRDRLVFVTDAMRGAGQKDGPSQLGGQEVLIRDGVVRLPNGSLAGSVLTLDQALRNAVAHGASLPEASKLLSGNPARYLGLSDRGALTPGRMADFVVLDSALQLEEVWIGGNRTWRV